MAQTDFRRSSELQNQVDQIGSRFLERILSEFDSMAALLEDCRTGRTERLSDLELFAHRIHGSGAIFGFLALSERAGELERQISSSQAQGDPLSAMPVIAELLALTQSEARAALLSRSPS